MSGGLRRALADLACRVLQWTLPPSLQAWGLAIRCETAGIPNDGEAFLFALNSLCGLMPRALASHLFHPFASLIGEGGPFIESPITINRYDVTVRRPRALGVACATGAVALGLAYMTLAGATIGYLGINIAALVIGLATLPLFGRLAEVARRWTGLAIALMAAALLATAILGRQVDGAARWVKVGGVAVQPSLILLPVMLLAFARTRDALSTAGIIAAVAAMALQPDRAMAGVLALGLAAATVMIPGKRVIATFGCAVAGFTSTMVHADTLSPVPYVDCILYSAFDVNAVAGIAVLGGSALLLVPAIIGWRHDPQNRGTYAIFGAAWAAAVIAAALGNYPTPVVGYGGSAIIGYVVSLLALPRRASIPTGFTSPKRRPATGVSADRHLLVGMA